MHENGSGHGVEVAEWKAHVARAYEAHAQRIAAALSRSFGSWVAEDAVQDVFMRALSWKPTLGRVENVLNFRFMKRCSARVAMRHVRTEDRRNRSERRRSDAARATADGLRTPDRLLELKERCELALETFSELPSWQRPVVYMIMVDHRTREDVARITGVRSTTHNNWRSKFVAELRHRLDWRD